MDKNLLGHKIKWLWVMKKLNTPLSVSSYPIGTEMGRRVFGYPRSLSATWYDYGDIYFDQEEIGVIKEFISDKIQQDFKYPQKIAQRVFKLADRIRRQKLNRTYLNNASLKQLVGLLKKESELFLQMIGFMSYRGSIQMGDVLDEELKTVLNFKLAEGGELDRFKKYLEILSRPAFSSIIGEEKAFSLEQSIGFKNLNIAGQNIRINKYLKNYEWLAYHWFVGLPPTTEEVRKRFTELAPKAKKNLEMIKREKSQAENEISSLAKKLKFNTQEKFLLNQYRTWLFLRTFIKDAINQAGYKLLPLLYQIAERKGLGKKAIVYLTWNEILNIEKQKIGELSKKINSRQNGFSAGVVNNIFFFRKFSLKPKEVTPDAEQIKGMTAFQGVVKGRVRVLHSPKDKYLLKKGEILVTSMTTPDYLPAMEKAKAFVTDEGGITCHAAIVAREMKKPCVIGTKNATKVLHDGDLVEVNANYGWVRKIK